MNKIVIIYLFTFLNIVFAQNIEVAKELFHKKEYSESYSILQKLFLEDMSNIEINFYLGRNAFELGKLNEAQIAFDRVLIYDENNLRAELELGRILLLKGNIEEAKVKFNRVLSFAPPEEVKENIKKLLIAIEDRESDNSFIAYLNLGVGFETNINSSAKESEVAKYLSVRDNIDIDSIDVEKREDSIFHNESIDLQYLHKFSRNIYLNSGINLYNQDYTDSDKFDIIYFGGFIETNYQKDRHKASLMFSSDRVHYGESPLLYTVDIEPKYSFSIDRDKQISTSIGYKWKNYLQKKNSKRDSTQRDFSLSFSKLFSTSLVAINYRFLDEVSSKESSNFRFIDQREQEIWVIYKTSVLPFNIITDLRYRGSIINFSDKIGNNSKRVDYFSSYSVVFSKELFRDLSLSLNLNYINNSSNYTPMDYDKSIYSTSLSYKF